jgi:hypothetical protein
MGTTVGDDDPRVGMTPTTDVIDRVSQQNPDPRIPREYKIGEFSGFQLS